MVLSVKDRIAEEINVLDFGAVGDGVTDDAPAINRALNYARTITFNNRYVAEFVIPRGTKNGKPLVFHVKSTLNFTGFFWWGLRVRGGYIYGTTAGAPVIDARGSRYLHWDGLFIEGAQSPNSPNVGIVFGRYNSTINADDNLFVRPTVLGVYTLAAVVNKASESTTFIHPEFANESTSSGTYCLIQDGQNHFSVPSVFVTENWTTDVVVSFNGNTFLNGYIEAHGSGIPLWVGGARDLKFINCYILATTGTTFAVEVHSVGQSENYGLWFDIHPETGLLNYAFQFTGHATPIINGFHYYDHNINPITAVFQKGSGVTGVTLNNLDLHMMNYLGSAAIFDDPTTFTINNGRIFSSIAQVLPTAFQGIYMDAVSGSLPRSNAMSIKDGITVPDAISGQANLFVDVADGSLKVIFGNGNIIVIATNP